MSNNRQHEIMQVRREMLAKEADALRSLSPEENAKIQQDIELATKNRFENRFADLQQRHQQYNSRHPDNIASDGHGGRKSRKNKKGKSRKNKKSKSRKNKK